MDFLTPYSIYLISFLIFLGGFYYYAYPLLIQSIDQYINDIKDKIYHAEKKHQEAEAQLIKSQDKHQEATARAEKILKEAYIEEEKADAQYKKELSEYEARQKKVSEEKVSRLEHAITEDIKGKIIEETMKKSEELFTQNFSA